MMTNQNLQTRQYKADLCVIGGGIAGICAAIAAAREGASVVLMHDRPMFGGNASSEIRMWVCGAQGDNVTETGILEELFMENLKRNPYKRYSIFDSILWDFVRREERITSLLNCSCMDAEMIGPDRIGAITGWQMTTQCFCRVEADYFADCSGDSILAPLTGAHYRVGRESASEFGEKISEKTADRKTMGNSCLLQGRKTDHPITFTAPPFAKKLTDEDVRYRCPDLSRSTENYWYLELGGDRDTIGDAESIRDELIALAYGMWDYIKNSGRFEDAPYWDLDFVGYLPGKRESRRMVGRYLMTQNDITSDRDFPDVVAFGGWGLDDHDPAGFYYDGHPNTSYVTPAPYAIPLRTLYSENIENLFFAGRNISMTHAAMSSTRVMGTCAVCGQAAGTAAALASFYHCSPDEVYTQHLGELQEKLLWNDCLLPHHPRSVSELTRNAKLEAFSALGASDPEVLRDGNDREHVWIGYPGDRIVYRFDEPQTIHQIRLIFDSDLNRTTLPGDTCERKHMTRCNLLPDSPVMHLPTTLCEAFSVKAIRADGSECLLYETKQNDRRMVRIDCPPDQYQSVTLQMDSACCGGEEMRLFSFDLQ